MGSTLLEAVTKETDLRLCAALERTGHPAIGQDAGTANRLGPVGVLVTNDTKSKLDVLADFSSPAALHERLDFCVDRRIALLVGTTGLSEDDRTKIRRASTKIPCIVAPNTSLGANLLTRLVAIAAGALGKEFDVEIVEVHHKAKKDAPSGTALRLAGAVCEALGRDPAQTLKFGRRGQALRGPEELGVHAVRGGDIVGHHRVMFFGPGEMIELCHFAQSRAAFASGAVKTLRFLSKARPGLYTMENVLHSILLDIKKQIG
jgi:4-hydroxy-tetrahydrodipicolinate reductase